MLSLSGGGSARAVFLLSKLLLALVLGVLICSGPLLVFAFCRTCYGFAFLTVLSPAVFLCWCFLSFMQVGRTCVGLQRKLGCDVSSDSSLLPFLVVLLLVTPLFPLCVKELCFRSRLFPSWLGLLLVAFCPNRRCTEPII